MQPPRRACFHHARVVTMLTPIRMSDVANARTSPRAAGPGQRTSWQKSAWAKVEITASSSPDGSSGLSCRTSLTTRLIMLLGAYAGRRESLSISSRNPIKFYELRELWKTHNALLKAFTEPNKSTFPFHAQGLDFTSMTAAQLQRFQACWHSRRTAG